MTILHYTARVTKERHLELPQSVQDKLHLEPGQEIKIQLDQEDIFVQHAAPNTNALAALQEIAKRQSGRRHTEGSQTENIIREGRSGAIYGADFTS